MVCGFDFDYPEWFYKTVMYLAAIGALIAVVFIFVYSSASSAEVPNNTLITASLWTLISGVILIVPAIIVFFTRSSDY
ncbi:MAG: hypothetical protein ACTSQF_05490 [Candidatus Heimdallarchaeaceae archaeon]